MLAEKARAGTPEPEAVLEIARGLARELQPQGRSWQSLTLDSSLERDLGLDSLGRVELLARLEKAFGVRLPEEVLGSAETPRDLLRALLAAHPAVSPAGRPALVEPLGAGESAPDRTRSLVEVLEWHAQRHPERRHILYLPGDGEPEELTYGGLLERSRAVAAGLAGLEIGPGQAVGLMLPTGLEYFAAFFGVQLAGGIPVPLYPPARKSQIEDHLRRQAGILRTAGAEVLVTFPEVLPLARLLGAQLPGLRRVVTVAELAAEKAPPPAVTVREDDIAFLQFTSGSTGSPKGVILTHANLLANLRAIGQGAEIRPEDVVVSWLPLYHDMGLIGCWMGSLYFGMPLVLMSPLTFLARPARWLWTLDRYRGTLSAAPNFAYELCVNKISDEEIEGLDLSSWRMALNGAEPVSPEAVRRFIERYVPHGFNPGTLAPVYGLAENSLALAFPPLGRPPLVDVVDREAFERSGKAVPVATDDPHALRFVSCGLPLPNHEIRILDEHGRETGDRQEGRLEFKGPSATPGYFRNPEATAELVRGEWRSSGDRAYIAGGEVYITGRVKDIIIRAGRNLYPHELEEAVGGIAGVRKGCVAVFGSPDPAMGTERLVVMAETREKDADALESLRQAIQDVTVDLLGTPADVLVLVPPHSVPKTSSGKIRRSAARQVYESGRIGRGGAALAWQLARLGLSAFRSQVTRRAGSLGEVLYTVWVAVSLAVFAVPIWLAVVLPPGLARRRRLARSAARFFLGWVGIRLRLDGAENLAAGGPRVLASNHASYLDGIALTALLPSGFAFVVKRELEKSFIARVLLRRLGSLFVERFDASQGAAETRKALEAVQAGESLLIFPEGTFRRYPGLLPFRMGAFAVAVDAGVPVVPVTIRGTRSVLRGDERFVRRGAIAVSASPPVHPEGPGWHAGVRLRDEVRAAILERYDEPDLA
ncbi:MAG TPA: AMP-binding protein [Thermoanaerobaculia bacterium]|jgi:1-acyl-sn-glycerol-3-phosphate acyltransferase|nr:AMP-binding protein [Thermoanaerobaculia bacterium]